jgi:hypothetical protein
MLEVGKEYAQEMAHTLWQTDFDCVTFATQSILAILWSYNLE